MNVPFIDLQRELRPLRAQLDAAIGAVLDRGVFVGGTAVSDFEAALAAASGANHAIGTSSGSDALLALAMALGWEPGQNIVTSPFSFIASASCAVRVGATVRFADIEPESLTLAPQAALAACDSQSQAIVTVNLFGLPAELPTAAPVPLIEDAAQSIGAATLRGLAATYSFFPTKNIGALGDGGAVVTNDANLATRLTKLRNHGAAPKYHHELLGGNFRLDALQAAVLQTKLAHLANVTATRRHNAQRYRDLFAAKRGIPSELRLPPHDARHVYHQFVIQTPRRDALRLHLQARGIGTEVYYPEPLHLQPCFAHLGYRPGSMPHAERACQQVLALPIFVGLTSDEQATVVDAIASFFA